MRMIRKTLMTGALVSLATVVEMKKLLSAAAALGVFAVLGAGSSQADVINNANVWINQPSAGTTLVPTPPIAGLLIPGSGAMISFNLMASTTNPGIGTVTQFANSAPPAGSWAVLGTTVATATLDATPLSNGILPPNAASMGTIFQFTGTITNNTAAPQQLSITHDDGISVTLDAFAPFADLTPAPPHNTLIPAANGGLLAAGASESFNLFYGECCGLPAVLDFLVGTREVTNTPAPEPTSLALLGAGLFGLGLLRRRRRTS